MAKKSSSRRSLKNLFSRSEARLDEVASAAAERHETKHEGEEKKKFRFPKFKTKSKRVSSGSGSVRPEVLSDVESNNTAEDGEACTNNVESDNKRSIYATAPRSKGKEFSYSELDLRKPKRFATFSFGLKKKKRKDDNISKSVFGLHDPDIEEQEETTLDLSQMELDQGHVRTMFSMSQPELDISRKFDIPSPPPVAANQSDSYFTIPTQPESQEPLNHSDLLELHSEMPKAPTASVAELRPGDEEWEPPVRVTAPASDAESSALTTPSPPAIRRPVAHETSDPEAAVVESVGAHNGPCDSDDGVLRQPCTNTEIPPAESTSGASTGHQPRAPGIADGPTQRGEHPMAGVDSQTLTIPGGSDDDSSPSAVSEEPSICRVPEASESATAASADRSERRPGPYSQGVVYGALYESLFPQSFTSEITSALSNPPPGAPGEGRRPSEPVTVKTLSECHTELNVTYSRLPSSRDFAASRVEAAESHFSGTHASTQVLSTGESSRSFAAADFRRDTDAQHRYRSYSPQSASEPTDRDAPYSELTPPRSVEEPGGLGLDRDPVRSAPAPVVENWAPPASEYVTSQGTDARVTDTKQRVILVKELVTEEAFADSVSSSPLPEKMSTIDSLQIRIESTESFYAGSGSGLSEEEREGPLSPAYLSVGSDDGSAVDIYYSAEENNEYESSEEETLTMMSDEGEEEEGGVNVVEWGEMAAGDRSKADGGDVRVVIVKMQSELAEVGEDEASDREALWSRRDVQQQVRAWTEETGAHETAAFPDSNYAKWLENGVATTTELTQIREDEEEEEEEGGWEEEVPATPVGPVSSPMACEAVPPSDEPRVQGEGSERNLTEHVVTGDHLNGAEQRSPSRQVEYLGYRDVGGTHSVHAASWGTREEAGAIPPTAGESADEAGEESGENPETEGDAVTGASHAAAEVVADVPAHRAQPQSDALQVEHNRAPRVDTITQSTGVRRSAPEQVAVEPSADNQPADGPRRPAEGQAHLNQGSLTADAEAPEVSASGGQPTEGRRQSVEKMNVAHGSRSITLTMSNPPPQREDESRLRFGKVSLITGADGLGQDADVDSSRESTAVAESNGAGLVTEYTWRNRFDGVSRYTSHDAEDSSFSDPRNSRASDTSSGASFSYSSSSSFSSSSSSSSSALPTPYTYQSGVLSSSHSSPSSGEGFSLGNRLSDTADAYLSWPGGERGRGSEEREEPAAAAAAAPAGDREREGESRWDSQQQQLPASDFSSLGPHAEDDDSQFTGLFKATLVELVCDPAAPPPTPPASPDADSANQFDMDSLVDTLKSMGPSFRPRCVGPRPPPQASMSSLPPIVEDAASPATSDVPASPAGLAKKTETSGDSLDGIYTLPPDLGLKRSYPRDTRSPLELMKQSQQDLQLQSAANGIVSKFSADSSPEDSKSPVPNGNGTLSPPVPSSRLDNSIIFSRFRSSSIDHTAENGMSHRPLFRTSSLPDTGPFNERMSAAAAKEPSESDGGKEPAGSRFERISFLMNSTPSSSSGSLPGAEDPGSRMSRPPPLNFSSPPSSNSPVRLLSPTGSVELHRPFSAVDSPLSLFSQTQGMGMGMGMGMGGGAGTQPPPILQRSFSSEGIAGLHQTSLFNSAHGGSVFQRAEPELDRNLVSKYRAFPDAYLTKEKEHGKLNPRPGKIYIFDRPGMCGQRIETRSDVIDATSWELQETISIRVVRGGWVLYEKPNFKGEKIALDEGDIELTFPFSPPEEQVPNEGTNGEQQNGETETVPPRRFIIGSLRRAVRDYSVPEISLFPEENAEGKKVIFRDTSDDARIFGFPVKANSIIINAGLWLVYAQPFFQGIPRVLEVGGYSNPAAWGVENPYVGSVHPLKVGEPRVENISEPKLVIHDKPYFSGKSRTITTNMRDFMTRIDRQQSAFMYNASSLKVLGGIWVGYEKEGFRGRQYLLEEGEYQDWRVWGGRDAELRSVRLIRADLSDPIMVMFEQPEEEGEEQEENTFEVTEAIPDVELFDYKTSTSSIHVLSGAWVAYSHVDFSGDQYILEKGFYNNCADWGSQDTRICSVQPIRLAPYESSGTRNEIVLYSEPDFQGKCHIFNRNQETLPDKLVTKSCRVVGGSWVLYENEKFSGNLYVLHEGDYPNVTSMGCPSGSAILSAKVVPMTFAVPSLSLFGLECLEGREITTEAEILSMTGEGFNNHILSVRVNSGCWVICEHSNYRGRQFILETIEITNWPKFSSINTIGSVYPITQKRHLFRIKNQEGGLFMSVQGGVEDMKSGRVVVAAEAETMSDVWFYQDGFIKNKMSPTMSLQVMGNVEPASKVVLWSETRQPIQTWTTQMRGLITSLNFPGMVLDVKGGKTYDKDHVVVMPENEERPSQQWEIELL